MHWWCRKKLDARAKIVQAALDEVGASARNTRFEGNSITFFQVRDVLTYAGNYAGSFVTKNERFVNDVRADASFHIVVHIRTADADSLCFDQNLVWSGLRDFY